MSNDIIQGFNMNHLLQQRQLGMVPNFRKHEICYFGKIYLGLNFFNFLLFHELLTRNRKLATITQCSKHLWLTGVILQSCH